MKSKLLEFKKSSKHTFFQKAYINNFRNITGEYLFYDIFNKKIYETNNVRSHSFLTTKQDFMDENYFTEAFSKEKKYGKTIFGLCTIDKNDIWELDDDKRYELLNNFVNNKLEIIEWLYFTINYRIDKKIIKNDYIWEYRLFKIYLGEHNINPEFLNKFKIYEETQIIPSYEYDIRKKKLINRGIELNKKLINNITKLHWQLLTAPFGKSFIASEKHIVKLNYNDSCVGDNLHIDIGIALSSKLYLRISYPKNINEFGKLTVEECTQSYLDFINKKIIETASTVLLSSDLNNFNNVLKYRNNILPELQKLKIISLYNHLINDGKKLPPVDIFLTEVKNKLFEHYKIL